MKISREEVLRVAQLAHLELAPEEVETDISDKIEGAVVPIDKPHRTADQSNGLFPGTNGDSVGHWDGDTLVVDVTNFDDTTWLQDKGAFHTDKLHVTERLRREGDNMFYEFTAEDPAVLAAPLSEKRTLNRMNYEIEEAPPCIERDRPYVEQRNTESTTR